MKRISAAIAVLLALPNVALAQGRNLQQGIAILETVEIGSPLEVTIQNPHYRAGYLVVATDEMVGAAKLSIKVINTTAIGEFEICDLKEIADNGLTAFVIGTDHTPKGEIFDVCEWPVSIAPKFRFEITSGTSFRIVAGMLWIDQN